jgi:hypothetical protein
MKKATIWHMNKDPKSKILDSRDRMKYLGYNDDLIALYRKKEARAWKKAQQVLCGNILGFWGATSYQAYLDYIEASGYDFREFYAKNLEHEINRLDPETDLGYNSAQYDFFRVKKLEAREANNVQRSNFG